MQEKRRIIVILRLLCPFSSGICNPRVCNCGYDIRAGRRPAVNHPVDCKSTGTNARRTKNSTFSAFIDIFVRFVNFYDHERPKSDIGRLRCRIFVVFLKGLRKEHPMFNLKTEEDAVQQEKSKLYRDST